MQSNKYGVPSVIIEGIHFIPSTVKQSAKREGFPFEVQAIYNDGKLRQDTMYITVAKKDLITKN